VGENGSQAKTEVWRDLLIPIWWLAIAMRNTAITCGKKRARNIQGTSRASCLVDCLPGTRMDKLADFQTRLGTALLIVDGDDSSLQVVDGPFREGLMVLCS
jgi:hypothetical protein